MSKRKREPRDESRLVQSERQLRAEWGGQGSFSAQAYVIPGRKCKQRTGRKFGKFEFVVAELLDHFNGVPPEDIGKGHAKALVEIINLRLACKPDYQARYPNATVNHMTVGRAVREARKRNR
jgi:hypothetical protein